MVKGVIRSLSAQHLLPGLKCLEEHRDELFTPKSLLTNCLEIRTVNEPVADKILHKIIVLCIVFVNTVGIQKRSHYSKLPVSLLAQ